MDNGGDFKDLCIWGEGYVLKSDELGRMMGNREGVW